MFLTVIAFAVLALSFLNLIRMAVFMLGSDFYDIKSALHKRTPDVKSRKRYPLVSVLVPAHNEELVLKRNLMSIYASEYKNIELIVINDSSDDRTAVIARSFQKRYGKRFKRMKIISVQVRGKAPALNAGLKQVRGPLFMCLDADSALLPTSISAAVQHFEADKKLVSVSSNVKIFTGKGVLNLFQRIEYLICYQMKKAETFSNTQYIVGGIGSMFRTQKVRAIGGYDTNTITEDIDLSMKILHRYGSKDAKIGYFPDVVALTEAVPNVSGLLRQRYRWKYGRYQTFLKYKDLFWSRRPDQNKFLGWMYLPYALLGEVLYFIEPLVVAYILFLMFYFGNPAVLAGSFIVFALYTILNISGATKGYSRRERFSLIAAAPFAYIGMYILSFVEYVATVRGFIDLPKIFRQHASGTGGAAWKHVKRTGNATVL